MSEFYDSFNTNFLRTSLLDYFSLVGAQASRDTTIKDANSTGSLKILFPPGASTSWVGTVSRAINTSHSPVYRKMSVTFRFYYSATPTAAIVVFYNGAHSINLNTSNQLTISNNVIATLTSGTWYTIEFIEDQDWRGAGLGSTLVRVDGGTAYQLDSFGTPTVITFGYDGSKSAGPNVSIYINHLSVILGNSTTNLAPWLNNAKNEQNDRVPIAIGNSNDLTGVSEATNKYLNVDESPSNTTDYNKGGVIGSAKAQGFTFTSVTYGTTPRMFTVFNLLRALTSATPGATTYIAGDIKSLIRDNSVDYTEQTTALTAAYLSVFFGSYGRPADQSALSSAILNSMEGGVYTNYVDSNPGGSWTIFPTADGATYDGVWTLTGGTAGSAYTTIDEQSQNDGDYISSVAANSKQGLVYTFAPADGDPGDVIFKLQMFIRGQSKAAETNVVSIGVRIGGVDYLSDNTATWTATGFSLNILNLVWSGSPNNPATGNRWTYTELNSVEFYLSHTTHGGTGVDVSWAFMSVTWKSPTYQSAVFMVVNEGDAPTDNGAIPGAGGTGEFWPILTPQNKSSFW